MQVTFKSKKYYIQKIEVLKSRNDLRKQLQCLIISYCKIVW